VPLCADVQRMLLHRLMTKAINHCWIVVHTISSVAAFKGQKSVAAVLPAGGTWTAAGVAFPEK